jgi:hypothetical protein
VTNKLGSSPKGALKFAELLGAFKFNFDNDPDAGQRATKVLVPAMAEQTPGYESGGSLTVLRPDGSEASFSPVSGKGIFGPWAASVDGNDNIWVSNFSSASAGIVELCGFRTEHCPLAVKTGDAISPPGGYVGGGLQLQVDVGIGPAGMSGSTITGRPTRAPWARSMKQYKPKAPVRAWWSSTEWQSRLRRR